MKKTIFLIIIIFTLFIFPSSVQAVCVPPDTSRGFPYCGDFKHDAYCLNLDDEIECCDGELECRPVPTEPEGTPGEAESVTLPTYSGLEGLIGRFRWGDDATIGDIISTLLPLIFVLAGIILLVYILIGGFILLTSAGNPKSVQKGQKMLTNGIIGFLIVLASYWIAQIFQTILSINILG